MTAVRDARLDALALGSNCHRCGVAADEACRTSAGRPTEPHQARLDRAVAQYQKGQEAAAAEAEEELAEAGTCGLCGEPTLTMVDPDDAEALATFDVCGRCNHAFRELADALAEAQDRRQARLELVTQVAGQLELAVPTAEDHEAYDSVTWVCALESARENWTEHHGHEPSTDAELAELRQWALGYIASGLTEVYEGDHLDLIAGTAAERRA